MSDKLYEYMDWPEIEAVVYSEESEPRKILGPRVTENGILIQSFLPNAVNANVIVTKTKETYEMVMEDEAGYFAVLIPEKEIPKYKIEIEDNGKGIASKDIGNIFERFYRTDSSRNSLQGGSGIGLSIVKKIIEDHGGYVWATSKEGEGTCMHFVIRKYTEKKENEDVIG